MKTMVAALAMMAFGAQAETMIFGLPLGGKFSAPQCNKKENYYLQADRVCWSGKKLLLMPKSKLPEWATYLSFTVSLKKGKITYLRTDMYPLSGRELMEHRISDRFGAPSKAITGAGIRIVEWDTPDVHVSMVCETREGGQCFASFMEGNEHREGVARNKAEQEQESKARPNSM